jgi:uncharacterized protein
MNLKGERIIPASVERTWTALNDPQILKECINGCESIEPTGENQYLALMSVRIGPVNAKFKGRLQLSDIVPLESYKINFDGQGGVAGFGKGSAAVTLSPSGTDGQATVLNYVADAQVGGKIAQIGSRLVESAAAKIADDFFKAFEARMTTAPDDSGSSGGSPVATAGTPVDLPAGSGSDPVAGAAPAAGFASAAGAAPLAGTDPVASRAPLAGDPVAGTASGFAPSGEAFSAPSGVSVTAGDADPALSRPIMATAASTEPASMSAGTASASAGMASAAAMGSATSGSATAGSTTTGSASMAAANAASADTVPARPSPTLDHVLAENAQPRAAAGGNSTVWWIAGIIVVALLAYFFTR